MGGLVLAPQPKFNSNAHIIFEIFTHVVDTNLRHFSYHKLLAISQVCSAWRRVAIESPTLWTSIGLQVLGRKSQEWRDEVMRRTKQAPLSLSGSLQSSTKPETISFFLSILRHEWSRMRKVDINLCPALLNRERVDADELRQIFATPAPLLSVFSFQVEITHSLYSSKAIPPTIPIFLPGEAPALTEFAGNQFALGLEGSRHLSRLSVLSLGFPYTTLQLLELLSNLPSLTVLSLECHEIISPITEPLPYVTPANLLFISIMSYKEETLMPLIHLLDHIQPVKRVSLDLSFLLKFARELVPLDNTEREAFQRVLQTFTHSAFTNTTQDPISTTIELYDDTFKWKSYCRDMEPDRPHNVLFRLSVQVMPRHTLSNNDIGWFMMLFASCDLSPIQHLHFLGPWLFDDLEERDPRALLYKSLSSVRRLSIDPSLFEDVNPSTIFPNLKVLEIHWNITSAEDRKNLLFLLKIWKPSGAVIKTLLLSHAAQYKSDMSFLDKISRLRVTWEDGGSYFCGTGNPKMLDFSCGLPDRLGLSSGEYYQDE